MTRCVRCVLFLALGATLLVPQLVPQAGADDGARAGIAWFDDLPAARRVATETGRPLFIALHRLPRAASPQAAARFAAWIAVYQDEGVIAASRAFVCARRLVHAQEGLDPDDGRTPAVTHLVLDAGQQVLLREDAISPAPGAAGAESLATFLRRGLVAFGPIRSDAPTVDARAIARTERSLDGSSSLRPVPLPLDAAGVRLRLRWDLPAPTLAGAESDRIEAQVSMRWDGAGPFPLGALEFGAGEDVDLPVDVRFAEIEGLAELLTKGTHRVDLYLEPQPGAYPFSRGPLHVGRVWIDLGEGGGGGGGGGADAPQPDEPQPEEPEAPKPVPEGEPDEPPPPPEKERTEVVDPFVRDGDTVEKEDAIVAVEDPDSAVKPPKRVPLEAALRDFEKMKERAVAEEHIAPRDRAFVRMYFDALEKAARSARGSGGR